MILTESMIRCNYHTHTCLCKHARGQAADYCRAAVEQGVSVLGFSDHTPHRGDALWISVRMSETELPTYVSDVEAARREFPELRVLLGMECEYVPEEVSWYRDVLLGQFHLEYLLGAFHSYRASDGWHNTFTDVPDDAALRSCTDFMVEGMQSGLFACIAHPDLFEFSRRGWGAEDTACAHAICEAAAALSIPLEINANGLRRALIQDVTGMRRPYPSHRFWEIAAEYPIEVICCSDAHTPEQVWGNNDDAYAFARYYGLNVINETLADRIHGGGAPPSEQA